MRRSVLISVGAAGAVLVMVGDAPQARGVPAAPITMSGEQVTQSLVADLVYFYRHSVRNPGSFALSGGGTNAGIADTARGVSSAALVSRALAPTDPPGMLLTRLAWSGVCLVSNRANAVPTLSRVQLQDIVAGRATSWSQIPGSPRTDALVPVALPSTMGAERVFESVFIDDLTPIAWTPVTVLTGPQQRDVVEATPAAFGYIDLALTGPLHVIAYEGVACTRATIADGTYAARRPLGVATLGRPRGELRRFLRWATTSSRARRVIESRYVAG